MIEDVCPLESAWVEVRDAGEWVLAVVSESIEGASFWARLAICDEEKHDSKGFSREFRLSDEYDGKPCGRSGCCLTYPCARHWRRLARISA